MIDLLSSPAYSNQVTAALKEAGDAVLPVLDAAFYRSGQTDQVMLRSYRSWGTSEAPKHGSCCGKSQIIRISAL